MAAAAAQRKRRRGGSGPPPPPPPPPPRDTVPLRVGWQRLPPGDVLIGYFPATLSREAADEARRVLLPPARHLAAAAVADEGGGGGGAAAGVCPVGWEQRSVRVFGRERAQPRLVSYWADDPGLSYAYSGLTLEPRCWAEDGDGGGAGRGAGGGGGGGGAPPSLHLPASAASSSAAAGAPDAAQVARTLRDLRAHVERTCRACADEEGRGLLPPRLFSRADDADAAPTAAAAAGRSPPVGGGAPAPPPPPPEEEEATAAPSVGAFFNACLLNLYRGGRDAVGWHSDAERALGARPLVTSLSLGARRDFFLRRRPGGAAGGGGGGAFRPRHWCPLGGDGDVLVMAGRAQEAYEHCVPARKGKAAAATASASASSSARISLTLRRVLPQSRPG